MELETRKWVKDGIAESTDKEEVSFLILVDILVEKITCTLEYNKTNKPRQTEDVVKFEEVKDIVSIYGEMRTRYLFVKNRSFLVSCL